MISGELIDQKRNTNNSCCNNNSLFVLIYSKVCKKINTDSEYMYL